jgi:predicted acylesterase/phospholipase RssA/CRP-like cAMP-binding protein
MRNGTAMTNASPDFSALLECLSGRLPQFREALLTQPAVGLAQVDLAAGEVLLRRGEAASALYVVAAGLLRATSVREDGSELTLSEFGPGQMAGEMAILAGGGVYSASVSAAQDAVLVKVPRDSFDRIAAAAPEAVQELAEGIRARLARDQLSVGLTRLFGPLHESVLRYVESRVEWVRLQAGEMLFAEGDKGQDLYFVISGRLRAVAGDGRVLSEMSRGESIGEIALLTGEPRTASVVAVRDSDLVRISRETFDEIVQKYPKVMQVIAQIVVRRLRAKERTDPASASGMCIAVLGAGAGMPIAAFTERLVRALGKVGPTLHLSSQRVDELLNRPGIAGVDKGHAAGIRLAAWLDEQESRYRFLLYEADNAVSLWTQRCLRQADEILLVAEAGSDPALSVVEKTLLGADDRISKARQSLILLHSDGRRLPSGTSRWFAGRGIQRHFHIRLDREDDFDRAARCLGGVAIGLVFGGGGARGLAHIGVIRALREAGVSIDMIGGTSMGAVIGAALGMGFEWKEILEISRNGWLRHKPHKEYTLPFISLIRTRVLDRWAKEIYGETDIEDLWLNFFCVSCNLTTSETAILERGSLWRAVRASSALPGVFVPVLNQGNVFVDGAIVNNLPGDIMRKRSCRTVIVIDVGSAHTFAFNITEFPSPWRFLWNRMLPVARRIEIPNIGAVLMRTTEVGSNAKTNEVKKDADLCLRPPIDEYGVLEFEAIDRIVDVGYRYAKEKLEALRGDAALGGIFGNPPGSDLAASGRS